MKIVVLADTHTRGPSRSLPSGAWPYIEVADHILHGGDVCDPQLLDELEAFAPVTAVMGNCDALDVKHWGALPETVLDLEGVTIAMVHDSGPKKGRARRLTERFPSAMVIVFAHSHMPVNEMAGPTLLFNPGSPTWKRMAPYPSLGILYVEDGRVEADIIPV
nr:metallophosphoesterase family protein [Actinomycetota bacterium]